MRLNAMLPEWPWRNRSTGKTDVSFTPVIELTLCAMGGHKSTLGRREPQLTNRSFSTHSQCPHSLTVNMSTADGAHLSYTKLSWSLLPRPFEEYISVNSKVRHGPLLACTTKDGG